MRLTVAKQYQLLDWAAKRLGTDLFPPESEAMGVIKSAEDPILRAVIVMNAFYGAECHMHIASDGAARWASPNILGGIFGYVFEFKKIERISARVAEHNISTLCMALKLGFAFEGKLTRGAMDGSSAILLAMTADTCRWIGKGAGDGRKKRT